MLIKLRYIRLVGDKNTSPRERVGNSIGRPPDARTPLLTASTNSGIIRWQLLKPDPVEAIPTMGRSNISVVYPIDFMNERLR
jgi:hypothetical protein